MGLKAPRGTGWVTNPGKAAYNRAYSRVTFDLFKARAARGRNRRRTSQPQGVVIFVVGGILLLFWLAS